MIIMYIGKRETMSKSIKGIRSHIRRHVDLKIGQRITYFRQQRIEQPFSTHLGLQKWSQAWVGMQLNCANQKVSNWETGTRSISDHDLQKLLKLFDISLEEFLGDIQLPSLYEVLKHLEDDSS
jgi:transcriptional regulator with XRE-family HTH domain